MTRRANDLTGQRFGRLVVLHRHSVPINRYVAWVCRCDCGGRKVASSQALTQGNTKSCGCLKLERLREESRVRLAEHELKRKDVVQVYHEGRLLTLTEYAEVSGEVLTYSRGAR